jgi:hypothetical protein
VIAIALLGCTGEPSSAPAPVPPAIPAPASTEPVLPEIAWSLPTHHATSPAAVPVAPDVAAARAILDRVVRAQALDPENPWAVKHAMLALGSDLTLTNGRDAVDWLFETYAQPVELGGHALIEFPTKAEAPSGAVIRVEPHGDLLLKGLAVTGVSPERVITVRGVAHPVGDLYKASLLQTWVDGDKLWTTSWNDTPWTLEGLVTWAPPGLAWTAVGGHPMTLDGLTHAIVAKLHSETQFIRDALAAGQPFQKQKQGIFAYTCGGAHLIQGSAYAVARGFGEPGDRASIEAEVPALFARYPVETAQVDQALAEHPEYRLLLLSQRLKFLGHFLESVHELAAEGFYTPDAAQQAITAEALGELVVTVNALDTDGYEQLNALKADKDSYQLYLDLVGDSAHALHGIDLATGKRTVDY